MNCKTVLKVIEDYHYGDLERGLASEVRSHLSACPSCTRELAFLAREDELFKSFSDNLERNLQVSPAIWQRVRAGMVASAENAGEPAGHHSKLPGLFASKAAWFAGSRSLRHAAFAALVAALSIAGTLVVVRVFSPPAPQEQASARGDSTSQNSLQAAIRSVQRAEVEYVQAIRLLSDIVDKQKEKLDPGRRVELERSLKAMDEAIAKARQAYHAHPSDPELGFYMLAAYREKVDLLQELATS